MAKKHGLFVSNPGLSAAERGRDRPSSGGDWDVVCEQPPNVPPTKNEARREEIIGKITREWQNR